MAATDASRGIGATTGVSHGIGATTGVPARMLRLHRRSGFGLRSAKSLLGNRFVGRPQPASTAATWPRGTFGAAVAGGSGADAGVPANKAIPEERLGRYPLDAGDAAHQERLGRHPSDSSAAAPKEREAIRAAWQRVGADWRGLI